MTAKGADNRIFGSAITDSHSVTAALKSPRRPIRRFIAGKGVLVVFAEINSPIRIIGGKPPGFVFIPGKKRKRHASHSGITSVGITPVGSAVRGFLDHARPGKKESDVFIGRMHRDGASHELAPTVTISGKTHTQRASHPAVWIFLIHTLSCLPGNTGCRSIMGIIKIFLPVAGSIGSLRETNKDVIGVNRAHRHPGSVFCGNGVSE